MTSSRSSPVPTVIDLAAAAIAEASLEGDDEDSDFHGQLAENQRRVIESVLLDPVTITFDDLAERLRSHGTPLPAYFYRTFYETSATLSKYVPVDMHTKHRTDDKLKMEAGMAFQPVAKFNVHGYLHREGIERQLVWNQKKDPSAFISVFNELCHAKRRAGFHHDESQRIGQRVSIARISSEGLEPVTVHAQVESKICIYTKEVGHAEVKKWKKVWRDVDIPAWVHKKAREKYGNTIDPEQLTESGADMWVSITEIRLSNLKNSGPSGSIKRDSICAKGHDYEWLSCGSISDDRILNVWPWDGRKLHTRDPGRPIRSVANSGQPWVWDMPKTMWVPDWIRKSDVPEQAQDTGKKRKRNDDDDDEVSNDEDDEQTAAILTDIIMAHLKRTRRSNSDAADDSDDEATPAPDSMSVELLISSPSHAPQKLVIRPEDYA
ncbi:uncharacterized protein J4E78_007114 [Alternaria triticimaculans]|uniref:uncharacterized protein n=1 Tax=Alternaria triticimaculans TaxID=297637 RepID=UPI0020C46DB8|nr:uncharacterized protein J4E78_007114 [Alternaria triticimaculans]KAI4654935.1 hypothetical protein J4E78_007114 [Alternaria triticimaculans]